MPETSLGVRHHLDEIKTSPQCGIQQCDRPIGGIHGADDVQVIRHSEFLLGIRERDCRLVITANPLGFFNQRNQLTENLRDIAAIDFIDDQDVILLYVTFFPALFVMKFLSFRIIESSIAVLTQI